MGKRRQIGFCIKYEIVVVCFLNRPLLIIVLAKQSRYLQLSQLRLGDRPLDQLLKKKTLATGIHSTFINSSYHCFHCHVTIQTKTFFATAVKRTAAPFMIFRSEAASHTRGNISDRKHYPAKSRGISSDT